MAAAPTVPWLRIAGFTGDLASGPLEGLGSDRLAVYTSGRDLAPGRHEAAVVLVEESGGRHVIPAIMERQTGFPRAAPLATDAGRSLTLMASTTVITEVPTPLAGLTRFTVEFWLQEDGVRLDGQVFAVSDSASQRLRLSRYEGDWRWRLNEARFTPEARFPATIAPGSFQHIAVVQDGSVFRFYADGVLLNERDDMPIRRHPTAHFSVGREPDDRSYLHGAIDELRIWDVALTAEQIRARMNASLTGAEADLVTYWRFDELDGEGRVPDLSGNGQHGRVWAYGSPVRSPRLAASTARIAVESTPELSVNPTRMRFSGSRPDAQLLRLDNSGGGVLTWSVRSRTPWLKLSRAEDDSPVDELHGEGPVSVRVRANGQGFPSDTYEGIVLIEHEGDVTELPVALVIRAGPTLGPDDELVSMSDVPAGAWSDSFARSVAEALDVDLATVATELSRLSGVDVRETRVVAVRPDGIVYVAGESDLSDVGSHRREARVWTSADRGISWDLLLHLPPTGYCDYGVRVNAAALHPDGSRVFLGTTNGLFLEDELWVTPPQAVAISTLHLSADGQYLWMATEDLVIMCEWPTVAFSAIGVYRARLDAPPMAWEDASNELHKALAPIVALGSDPRDSNVYYTLARSGALYRQRLRDAASVGWQRLEPADLPPDLQLRPQVTTGRAQLWVQDSYPRGWTPSGIDIKWGWRGLLFGRDGLAWAHYGGSFSHSERDIVIQSRDGGVTWNEVYGRWGYGWGSGDLEPVALAVDARGLVPATGSVMTGIRAKGVGPWNTDPIDPLTTYVAMWGRGLVYRTRDSGHTWERMGQGLPPTLQVTAVGVDSLGRLYLQSRDGVHVRQVAERVVRVDDATITPSALIPGDRAVVTARLSGWLRTVPVPADLEVRVSLEPDTLSDPLRDDGIEPDAARGDGVWSAAVAVPADRPYGHYAAVVSATPTSSPAARASQRVPYRIVPGDDHIIFDGQVGEGWTCADESGQSVRAAGNAPAGVTAMLVQGELTCEFGGGELHPFARTLELMVYSESSGAELTIQDVSVQGDSLPAGQWASLRLPAASLAASLVSGHDAAGPTVQAAHVGVLRFRSNSPIWLDDIQLLVDRPEPVSTAITGTPSPRLPEDVALLPPHPNPFNASTVIAYRLPDPAPVGLTIYNLAGQHVATLARGERGAGVHALHWDGRDDAGGRLASGVYLCRLRAGARLRTGKLLLLR